MKEELTEIINQVFKILKPLSESSGQHPFSVIFRSRYWGVMEFMLNWKCCKNKLQFNSTSEFLEKTQQLLEMTS
jgi:hypothetical protein